MEANHIYIFFILWIAGIEVDPIHFDVVGRKSAKIDDISTFDDIYEIKETLFSVGKSSVFSGSGDGIALSFND